MLYTFLDRRLDLHPKIFSTLLKIHAECREDREVPFNVMASHVAIYTIVI
jgi:hypothetical protein